MKLKTDPRPTAPSSTTEPTLPVSPGLEGLGDRVSFMGVAVAKFRGSLLIPDPQRLKGDVTTARSLKQRIVLEGNRVVERHDGKERVRCQ